VNVCVCVCEYALACSLHTMKENDLVFVITFSKICASVVLAIVIAGLIFLTKFVVRFLLGYYSSISVECPTS